MDRNKGEEALIQNLQDAGCDEETIRAFTEDLRKGRIAAELKRLAAHRCALLDGLHRKQKQIDCLDYLVYTLKEKGRA